MAIALTPCSVRTAHCRLAFAIPYVLVVAAGAQDDTAGTQMRHSEFADALRAKLLNSSADERPDVVHEIFASVSRGELTRENLLWLASSLHQGGETAMIFVPELAEILLDPATTRDDRRLTAMAIFEIAGPARAREIFLRLPPPGNEYIIVSAFVTAAVTKPDTLWAAPADRQARDWYLEMLLDALADPLARKRVSDIGVIMAFWEKLYAVKDGVVIVHPKIAARLRNIGSNHPDEAWRTLISGQLDRLERVLSSNQEEQRKLLPWLRSYGVEEFDAVGRPISPPADQTGTMPPSDVPTTANGSRAQALDRTTFRLPAHPRARAHAFMAAMDDASP